MKRLVILHGGMGVGKTTTCRELQKLYPHNVFLDGDWCWDMEPFVVNDETKAMVEGNIIHLLNSFLACTEFETVLFCWVMHEKTILEGLLARLNLAGVLVEVYTLVCSEAALAARVTAHIKAGGRDPDSLQRSIQRLACYRDMPYTKIDVSGITARQAARRIFALSTAGQDAGQINKSDA